MATKKSGTRSRSAKQAAAKRSSTRSRSSKQAAAKKSAATPHPEFPRRIFAIASPRSVGGLSMFEADSLIDSDTVANFDSDPNVVARAVELLTEAGFEVLNANTAMINIAGSRTTFERAFSTKLFTEQREVIKPGAVEDTATFIDTADTDLPGLVDTSHSRLSDVLEGVAIEEPYYPMAGSIPPRVDHWYLDVPDGVGVALNAARVHRSGRTGRNVTVAMVDTGWYRHPFFTARGYRSDRAILGPGAANPDDDENGHGTGESANVFAIAPDVRLKPIKAANPSGALVNMTAAFNAAVALDPDIITNSWGSSIKFGPLSAARQAQAAAIAAAVASGIVVCFSAGNGHWGFPGQHPDVISVGGVHRDQDGNLQASDYSSGFVSNVYAGRQVPDVCGMVGMRPGAQYIMLPVQDGDRIDVSKSAADGTASNDGWALFSGTSAACPQIAGVVALMKEACPRLTPAEIRQILQATAIDVTTGSSHPLTTGTTGPGPDTATGHGLVDAARAVAIARLRCLVRRAIPFRPVATQLAAPTPLEAPRHPVLAVRPAAAPAIPIRPFLRPPHQTTGPGRTSDVPAGAFGDAQHDARMGVLGDAEHDAGTYASGAGQDDAGLQAPGDSEGRLSTEEAEYLERLVMEGGDELLDEMG